MSTLYLVDDHVIVREGMRALFEAAGFDVVGEAGDVAIAAADIARLVPDVVLLDLLLGEHSGMDLLRVLQQNKSRSRVIVQTMAEQARYISEAVKLGAAGYVLKGSDGAEVVRAIHDVLEGRRHFSGPVAERLVDSIGAPQHANALATLSARERQILELVVRGNSSATIGASLALSPKTVDTYRSRLMAKLSVRDLASLVRLAVREGVIDSDR
ncbi:MAG: response regulator transcription factor [Burkholderiaceae bacterium]|nr:response regulator transcription factor [Burkholderiaceae bacterium]MBP6815740.1 response regulator transcription factor [Burkholderiaceae bacterium]